MNWQDLEKNWERYRPRADEHWGRFDAADLDEIAGHRDRLVLKIQEKYGRTKTDAEREAEGFLQEVASAR